MSKNSINNNNNNNNHQRRKVKYFVKPTAFKIANAKEQLAETTKLKTKTKESVIATDAKAQLKAGESFFKCCCLPFLLQKQKQNLNAKAAPKQNAENK